MTDSPGQPRTARASIRRPTAAISVHLHTKRSPAGRRASCGISLRSQRHSSIGPERDTHRKGLLSYRSFGPFESAADKPCRSLLTCQSLEFTHVTARPLSSCPHLLNCHLQSPFILAGRLYVSCFVAKVCSNKQKATNRPRPCDNQWRYGKASSLSRPPNQVADRLLTRARPNRHLALHQVTYHWLRANFCS